MGPDTAESTDTEPAGLETAAPAPGADRYGPHSPEVAAFIEAVGTLTPSHWRRVAAARRSVAAITREGAAQAVDSVRALLAGAGQEGSQLGEPMASVASALAGKLEGRTDEEVVAAWLAASALVRRRQLSPLTFAAHYMPFTSLLPPSVPDDPAPGVQLFTKALKWLAASQWEALARPWTVDREASAALLQAALKSRAREAEEATALAALAAVPKHLPGDAGWAAAKTAVHGGRVLSCRAMLSAEQLVALWAPLEATIPLRSLDEQPPSEAKAARPPSRRAAAKPSAPAASPAPAAQKRRPSPKRGALYGPNNVEVAAFVKSVPGLTGIQWLRILDRRQLVGSVTREGSAEPAAVVRAILAAIKATADLDLEVRCAILSAVERAGFALESRARLTDEHLRHHYGAFAEVVPLGDVDAQGFAARVAELNPEEWARLTSLVPPVDIAAVAPLLNAGSALADHLGERSDDEVVTTWQALTALLRRHLLSPIKFAVSYAPFASAVPVIKPRGVPPPVQRYLTAVGRLSAHQCALLAEPWLLADDVSNALSKAVADGSAKVAEEASALTALVTIPMRLKGNAGWAASKTVTFGGRVVASRPRVTETEFEALWKPLERAIPASSLIAAARSRKSLS